MRMINADTLRHWIEGECKSPSIPRAEAAFGKRILMHMEIMESEDVQPVRWIPCSERYPDDSGTYIVTAYDGAKERVTFAKYQKRLKRWELTGARAYWRVLAWMPLPEPWKGADE